MNIVWIGGESMTQLTMIGSAIQSVVDFATTVLAIYGGWMFAWNYGIKKTVKLSVGSFRMKRKDFNVQNVTNIVSASFYGGGKVPDAVREEIIRITAPKVDRIRKKPAEEDGAS